MRGRKKMNLRDVAIFVLFLVLFFMIFPPIFLSISDVSHGMSLWDSLNETTLDGLLLDWAVIIGIFVKCLTDKATPPLVSPSNFVKITPVSFNASLNPVITLIAS